MRSPICIIASGGGHLTEALYASRQLEPQLLTIITNPLPGHEKSPPERTIYLNNPHRSIPAFLKNAAHALFLAVSLRPRVVITTGAGMVVPFCIFARILGSKIIFIESGARIRTASWTGLVLARFADVTIVQWQPLLEVYPGATYGGLLL